MTMYRWHIADPIRFTRSLRVAFEHTGWISADESQTGKVDPHVEREDDIATVAFWYQVGQPKRFAVLPGRAERAWPEIDRVVEGQQMIGTATHSPGALEVKRGVEFTGAGQLLFVPSTDSAYLEVQFSAPDTALTGLVLRLTRAPEYGKWRILLDGRDVTALDGFPDWLVRGAQDLYGKELQVRDLYVGSFNFAPGPHTIRFEAAGRSVFSSGGVLGLDSVRLRERWHKLRKPLVTATPRR
jgi:hypothetical protein